MAPARVEQSVLNKKTNTVEREEVGIVGVGEVRIFGTYRIEGTEGGFILTKEQNDDLGASVMLEDTVHFGPNVDQKFVSRVGTLFVTPIKNGFKG